MRRIKIDSVLEKKVDEFYKNLFSNRDFTKPIDKLKYLRSKYRGIGRQYLDKIINEYDDILRAKPSRFFELINEFNAILKFEKFPKNYAEKIVLAMRYGDLRDNEYLGLAKNLGFNSCIYCNAQLANVINLEYYKKNFKDKGIKKGDIRRRKANFELDHFYPKSKYPFLCTSFYNLIPSCSSCNKAKSSEEALFMLYSEDDDLDVYSFVLDKDVELNYWNNQKTEEIKFHFTHYKDQNNIDSDDKKLLSNHSKLFRIQELYETQKDIVVELLHKSKAYKEANNRHLIRDFNELFPDKEMIERLLISNYTKPEDIHKRPMAKFTQDIARQLKLIK